MKEVQGKPVNVNIVESDKVRNSTYKKGDFFMYNTTIYWKIIFYFENFYRIFI